MRRSKTKTSIKAGDSKISSVCSSATRVYFCKIQKANEKIIYPLERQAEIDGAKSQKVKNEKYSAWKLLEYGVKDLYNKDLGQFSFKKLQSGKWMSDGFFFSISHTKNLVCVAISDKPIGVDIENLEEFEKKVENKKDVLWKKIASEKEYEMIKNPPIGRLSTFWTKKESIYKCQKDDLPFMPSAIDSNMYSVLCKKFKIFGERYVISICTL